MRLYFITLLILLADSICFSQETSVTTRSSRNPTESKVDSVRFYEKSIAVLIEVSEYRNGMPQLPGAKVDIDSVSLSLTKQGFDVHRIVNPLSADHLAIQLKSLILREIDCDKRCRLLVYFAGHGSDENSGALVMTGQNTAAVTAQDLYPIKQFLEIFKASENGRHLLVVLDGCFLGFVSDFVKDKDTERQSIASWKNTIPKSIQHKLSIPCQYVLTSGTRNQTVPDNSLFRKFFIQGIEGAADYLKDGYVTLMELKLYMEDAIATESEMPQNIYCDIFNNPLRPRDLQYGEFIFRPNK